MPSSLVLFLIAWLLAVPGVMAYGSGAGVTLVGAGVLLVVIAVRVVTDPDDDVNRLFGAMPRALSWQVAPGSAGQRLGSGAVFAVIGLAFVGGGIADGVTLLA